MSAIEDPDPNPLNEERERDTTRLESLWVQPGKRACLLAGSDLCKDDMNDVEDILDEVQNSLDDETCDMEFSLHPRPKEKQRTMGTESERKKYEHSRGSKQRFCCIIEADSALKLGVT